MFQADDERIAGIGRARESAGVVLAEFKQKPLLTITEITKRTGFAKTTAISAVNRLIGLGIIKNISEKKMGEDLFLCRVHKSINPKRRIKYRCSPLITN
jgi:DNA-binding transcriptional regulator GbsR (MarR family)